MRIDVVSIFPAYLAPLELSLAGKARAAGLLDVRVHDLRDWTHDRHRTVDDSPAGGGAGMVMKPEPWGEALDALLPEGSGAVLVVPTPSGEPLTQAIAAELADVPIVTSDNPRSEDPGAIIDEIVAGIDGDAEIIQDRRAAIAHAVEIAEPGDVVVIAGKGHEQGQQFRDRTVPFDDREVAREALRRLGAATK